MICRFFCVLKKKVIRFVRHTVLDRMVSEDSGIQNQAVMSGWDSSEQNKFRIFLLSCPDKVDKVNFRGQTDRERFKGI